MVNNQKQSFDFSNDRFRVARPGGLFRSAFIMRDFGGGVNNSVIIAKIGINFCFV